MSRPSPPNPMGQSAKAHLKKTAGFEGLCERCGLDRRSLTDGPLLRLLLLLRKEHLG